MRWTMAFVLLLVWTLTIPAAAAEFSADSILEGVGGRDTGKVYYKNSDISREEMMGMIIIRKYPLVYQLFTDTKKYVVSNIEEMTKDMSVRHIRDFKQFIEANDMKKVGSSTLEGYKCDIYEGEAKFVDGPNVPSMYMKFWYSSKLDYPVKYHATLPPPVSMEMASHLENIRLGKQPDTLFEIPAEYTQADSMEQAMGMEGFPKFPGMPKGMGEPPSMEEAPSQDEMQKMMEGVKDLMKRFKKP